MLTLKKVQRFCCLSMLFLSSTEDAFATFTVDKMNLSVTKYQITGVALAPDKSKLCVTGLGDPMYVMQFPSLTKLTDRATVPHDNESRSCNFSPDGRWMVSSDNNGTAVLWEAKDLTQVHTLTGASSSVSPLAFSPDSNILAAGGSSQCVHFWNLKNGEAIGNFLCGEYSYENIEFHPSEPLVVLAKNDRAKVPTDPDWSPSQIELYDLKSQATLFSVDSPERTITDMTLSPDGTLVAWTAENSIYLMEIATRKIMKRLHFQTRTDPIVFHPEGRYVLLGTDKDLWFVDILTGEKVFSNPMDGKLIWNLNITRDGSILLAELNTPEIRTRVEFFKVSIPAHKIATEFDANELEKNWNKLTEEDGFASLYPLVVGGDRTVEWIRTAWKKRPQGDELIDRLVAQLADDDYFKREEATKSLFKLGTSAAKKLRAYLKEGSHPEIRWRARKIVNQIELSHWKSACFPSDPEQLRKLRALQVLEYIGTESAMQLLKLLATEEDKLTFVSIADNALKKK